MPIQKNVEVDGVLVKKVFILQKVDLRNTSYAFILAGLTNKQAKQITDNTSDNGVIFFEWCKNLGRQPDEEIWVENV